MWSFLDPVKPRGLFTSAFTFVPRRDMAEILQIRRKTLSNQSINQSIHLTLYGFFSFCIFFSVFSAK